MPEDWWSPVEFAPEGKWLRTKKAGEDGENVCCWNDDGCGGREWVEREGGRTTITHHSFAAPTHWRPLEAKEPLNDGNVTLPMMTNRE